LTSANINDDDDDDNSSIHRDREARTVNNNDYLKSENNPNKEIIFTKQSHSYCIGMISIVNFIGEKESENAVEIRNYYSIFYNTMASIIRRYGGKVIKNVGDVILFYFPKTVNFSKPSSFHEVLECGLEMIKSGPALNATLNDNGLKSIIYKISVNYGKVELAVSSNSYTVDLFGPAVNMCSKINHLALPNQMVIYKDLYDILEKTSFFKDYVFKNIDNNKLVDKNDGYSHLVYSISRKYDSNTFIEQKNNKIKDCLNPNDSTQSQSNSSFNILLIDDDKDILFTFEPFIRSEGYNLTSFSDSKKALDHLSNLDPYYYDLIILDIRMPGFNGFQLYRQIKVLNPDTKTLFLTALDVFVDEIKIVCPGMNSNDVVRKPVHPTALLSKIATMLYS
jgi:two-component system, OmpR family, response regulator ChvI